MSSSHDLYAAAVDAYKESNYPEAEQLCREVLQSEPRRVEAWNLLGALYRVAQRWEEARRCFREALKGEPENAALHNNLGEMYRLEGEREEAESHFRKALAIEPNYAAAHNNLGLALQGLDRLEEAEECLRKAVALKPDYATAHCNLGILLSETDRPEEAAETLERALEIEPNYAPAYNALGAVRQNQGDFEAAISSYEEAIRLNPRFARAHANLGKTYEQIGKPKEAAAQFAKAIEADAAYLPAYCRLGRLHRKEENLAVAERIMERALEVDQNHVDALLELGIVLREQSRYSDALRVLFRAAKLDNRSARIQVQLAGLFEDLERNDEALKAYRRALKLNPDLSDALVNTMNIKAAICQWEDWTSERDRIAELTREQLEKGAVTSVAPFCPACFQLPAEMQLAVHRRWSEKRCEEVAAIRSEVQRGREEERGSGAEVQGDANAPRIEEGESNGSKKRRIRLAYLSHDFRNHPIAHQIRGIFALHSRDDFEVFAYSFGPDDDSVYRRDIERDSEQFIDIESCSLRQCVERILKDDIDILVDHMGYTKNSRPKVLAAHPARIQVSHIYPGSMGAGMIDYQITDRMITPPGKENLFHENLVTLPHSLFVCDDEQPISPKRFQRAECGLPEDGFVFCCFTGGFKIEPRIFGTWMRILKAVPGSVLWLYKSSSEAEENLKREALSRGVEEGRLIFATNLPKPEHLARHCLADLFLDTLDYNAGTTACDALWAGLPLISCPGESHASRLGASLLNAIGFNELIMPDLETYEQTAIRLAENPKELAAVKSKLEENRTTWPLFNTARWVRYWEKALRAMWERYERGDKPRAN